MNHTRNHAVENFLERLDRLEIPLVRAQAAMAHSRPAVRVAAMVINHLGNGWLFVLCGVVLWALYGRSALPIIGIATLSLGIAHGVYPTIKSFIARPRPMHRDQRIECLQQPLDRYSCPSGHCMTATAVAVPVAAFLPNLTAFFVSVWALIAWARLAVAHHYPSDIALGTLIGAAVAWPLTCWYLI